MSGDNDTESIMKSEPWGPQQPYLTKGYAKAVTRLNDRSEYYPKHTWVGMNDVQKGALKSQLNYGTNVLPKIVKNTRSALSSMLNAPDIANNPYIGGVADVMTKRLNRNLSENIMPTIQGNFNAAGQYGGGREDVMRQVAGRDTQEALSQGLAGLYADAYGQGLGQQAKGVVVSPQVASLGLQPSQIAYQVGDALRQEKYLPLQEDIARWNYKQTAPWDDLARYISAISGNVGQNVSSTQSQPINTFGNVLGGAMLGSGLQSALPASLTSGVPSWLGAGLGGLSGLFF